MLIMVKQMASWNTIIIITSIISLLFGLIIYKNRAQLFSFFSVYTIFYWIIMYSGIYISYALSSNFDFNPLKLEYVFLAIIYSGIAYAVFFTSYKLFTSKFKIKIFPKVNYIELRMLGYVLLIVNLLSILLYIGINGGLIIFKSASYSDRFESNLGLGGLAIFFPLFLLSFILLFLTKPTYRNWKINFFYGLLVAILIFLAIGGGRLMIALHTFIFLLIGYHYKYIKFRTITITVVIFVPLAALLAFVRAKMDFDSEVFQTLIFTMNTFSPFDSFVRIIEYYDNSNKAYEGFNVVYNQITSFVPRVIWPEKPIMVLNTGNFYTLEILNFKVMATISPTINGSFYIMYGFIGLIVGSAIIGMLLKVFDNSFYRNPFLLMHYNKNLAILQKRNDTMVQKNIHTSLLHLIFYYYVLLNVYILIREALDVFLITRVIIPSVLIVLFLIIVKIILRR